MSARVICPDGHESRWYSTLPADPEWSDDPKVAVCPVSGCGSLIRLCIVCDATGEAWARDGQDPTEPIIAACQPHLDSLVGHQLPPCEDCGEPTDYPGQWRCRRCLDSSLGERW